MNRNVSAIVRSVGFVLLALLPGLAVDAAQDVAGESQRLRARAGADTAISVHPATGVARFVRLGPGATASLSPLAGGSAQARADAFFKEYAGLFGIRDAAAELRFLNSRPDAFGTTRLTYEQVYSGVPVFAAVLRAHMDKNGRMTAANGVFVPGIDVPTQPRITAAAAAKVAVTQAMVSDGERGAASKLVPRVVASKLVIFRTGLVKGERGESRLAYQVEVSSGGDIHKDVFVDALTGKYLDAHSRAQDAIFRRSFDGANDPVEPGPNYPSTPFWLEGDPFPTGTTEADNMIFASLDSYNIFENGFTFDTGGLYPFFPATSGEMHSIFNRGWGCPNASWNSLYISFCPGFTTDDVTGHEWAHAYTEFTSGLIYQWQSGALNESYSDVWGEAADQINGRGADTPAPPRTAGACAVASAPAELLVNSPPPIAGIKAAQRASFGPPPTAAGTTGDLVRVDNGSGGDTACTADGGITNGGAVAGNVALIQRGNCTFVEKVQNAQDVGAIAVVIYNNATSGLPGMGGASTTITIVSVGISQADGQAIIANSPANATIRLSTTIPLDNSLLWLMGEEVGQAPGGVSGAIRDMWNPTCFSNPGKVSDTQFYVCSTADQGGVHTNSGVPNHAYALLVSGGVYNGFTVNAIGTVKTAHIFFRSQSQYLVPPSDFVDMADAMEQSCADLTGINLPNISTATNDGGPSGEVIGPADCAAVTEAIAAVELRLPPTFCNFQPLLNPNTPPACTGGQVPAPFVQEGFEADPFLNGWTTTLGPVSPDFTYRIWTWENTLPDRSGSGVFAIDIPGGNCAPGGDESGVIQLNSPSFVVAAASARLAFDHNVATESTYDGGNLKISVNGGPFNLLPFGAYTFNPPNATLQPTNPLAGEDAYTGTNGGANAGSWGTTVVDLTGIATAGDTVRLRWDFGQDGCAGIIGWYLDNLKVYSCQAPGGTPGISIADVAVTEGNAGLTAANFTVTLSPAEPNNTVSVQFQTIDGTATTADNDYQALNGTIVFAPNETSKNITISVVGDTTFEADETFTVSLSNVTGGTISDGVGLGTILNDDKPLAVDTRGELIHDSRETRDLDSISKFWTISQKAHSSYEVIVDAATGDIVGAAGPDLLRLDTDGITVLQTGGPATTGSSKSLRFENTGAADNNGQFIRVRSGGCVADCDTGDTFRIRAYDTTYRMARFNNSATQITVVLIQNTTDQIVTGNLWFYTASTGALAATQPVTLQPKATFVLNTSGIVTGAGSATFSNDAAFGALTGKAVAVEPATGFTFDTAMVPRTATTKMVPRDN